MSWVAPFYTTIPFQEEFWPAFVFGILKNSTGSNKRYNRFPNISLRLNFRISPSCQTLSKAFNMSKNTPLTSLPSSKDWYISWVIELSLFIQESPGRRPDWLEDNKSFSFKNLYSSLNRSLSKILLQIGSKEKGDCMLKKIKFGPFLWCFVISKSKLAFSIKITPTATVKKGFCLLISSRFNSKFFIRFSKLSCV